MRLVGGGISGHGENVRRTVATRGGHVRHPVIATLVFDLAWLAFSAGSAAQAPPATVTGPIPATVPPGDASRDFTF